MKARNFTFPAITISLLLLMTSCVGTNSKTIITKDFEVSDFKSLNLEVVGEIIFEQSSTPYLTVEGNENLVEELEVDNDNNHLTIKSDKQRRFFKDKGKLTLKIGSASLEEINQKGVGSFLIKGDFNAESLHVKHTGVGNFNIDNCNLEKFNLESQSVGNCRVKGTANTVVIESDGVGNIDCSDLITQNAKVVSQGVGNLSVHAENELNIVVKGIGNVTYAGNPEVLKTDITGIGKVKELR